MVENGVEKAGQPAPTSRGDKLAIELFLAGIRAWDFYSTT